MAGAFFYWVLWVGQRFLKLFWWRWEIEGLENLPPREQGGMVIATNHIHWFDVPILGASLPRAYRLSWIAKIEIFVGGVANWWLRQMQVIPIRRGARDLAAMQAAEQALRDGAVLTVFAEGHRSRDGKLQEGRGGAVRLASRAGVPILPVSINGTQGGPLGAFLRRKITIRIGKPYHPAVQGTHIPPARMDELTDEMMLKIAALLPEEQQGYYRERMLTTSGS